MTLSDKKKKFYARTMHTPDDAARASVRAALKETSRLLLPLHRALIDAAKAEYAMQFGSVDQPTRLLHLLNEDPAFAWLKPITRLIVDIDELARRDFVPEEVAEIADRIDFFFGTDADPAFSAHYIPILQRDIDVTIAHAELRKAAARLR